MKLTVIFGGRNDGYGDNKYKPNGLKYLDKIKYGIDSLHKSLGNIDYEIIMMDINPPEDKPLIYDSIRHSKVKSVVFSGDKLSCLVEKHLKNGAEFFLDGMKMPVDDILKCKYMYTLFFNECIDKANGEYILMATPDTIFPKGFDKIIANLSPNILYRCLKKYIYHRHVGKYICDRIYNRFPFGFVKPVKNNSVYKAAGDFLLADKNSWKEIGGFLRLPFQFMYSFDNYEVFVFLAYGKKICPIHKNDYYMVQFLPPSQHVVRRKIINYIINKNGVDIDYMKELREMNFMDLRRWLEKDVQYDGKIYFKDFSYYKKRHQELRQLLDSIYFNEV